MILLLHIINVVPTHQLYFISLETSLIFHQLSESDQFIMFQTCFRCICVSKRVFSRVFQRVYVCFICVSRCKRVSDVLNLSLNFTTWPHFAVWRSCENLSKRSWIFFIQATRWYNANILMYAESSFTRLY